MSDQEEEFTSVTDGDAGPAINPITQLPEGPITQWVDRFQRNVSRRPIRQMSRNLNVVGVFDSNSDNSDMRDSLDIVDSPDPNAIASVRRHNQLMGREDANPTENLEISPTRYSRGRNLFTRLSRSGVCQNCGAPRKRRQLVKVQPGDAYSVVGRRTGWWVCKVPIIPPGKGLEPHDPKKPFSGADPGGMPGFYTCQGVDPAFYLSEELGARRRYGILRRNTPKSKRK